MEKKFQAIIRIDGEIIYYFYDEDITEFINTWVKFRLENDGRGRKIGKVETELNSPPLKYDEVKR